MTGGIFGKKAADVLLGATPFHTGYELTIAGNILLGSVQNISETRITYDCKCTLYNEDLKKIVLKIRGHELVQSVNDAFTEMFEVTRKTMQMMQRVEVLIDDTCTIVKVLNAGDIIDAWKRLKSEKIYFQQVPITLGEIVSIDEEQLENPETLIEMVAQMEFFDLLKSIGYGYALPKSIGVKKPTMLRKGEVVYEQSMRLSSKQSAPSTTAIYTEGVSHGVSAGKLKEWYGGFPFYDEKQAQQQFGYTCQSSLLKGTNMPFECTLRHQEKVMENLQWNLLYMLKSTSIHA